jgi:signal transduction histidine kinase
MRPRLPAAGVDSSRPDSVAHWRRGDFASPEASARIEQVLAVARVFPLPMLVASLTNQPAMSLAARALAADVVTAYAVVCTAEAFLAVLASGWLMRATRVVHGVDLAFTTLLLHLMAPLPAPLVLVVFTLIAAAARWGSHATLVTGGVTLAAFVVTAVIDTRAAFSMWRTVSYASALLALTLMFTALAAQARMYFAQREALARGLASMGAASSFADALRLCLSECLAYFGAPRALLAVEDLTSRQGYLWTIDRTGGPRPLVEEMSDTEKLTYFGDSTGDCLTWFAQSRGTDTVVGRGLSSAGRPCSLSPAEKHFARTLFAKHRVASLLTADTVTSEWRLRLLVLDPSEPFPDALPFVRLFVDRAAPILQRDYDVRALRSRVGAIERGRIARELHDGPVQSLAALDLEIERLRLLAEMSPVAPTQLVRLRAELRKSIAETRDLMVRLRPTATSGDDVLRVIAELATKLRRDAELDVRLVSTLSHLDCSSATSRHLTRIVQEALTNVRKHSGARSVTISLSQCEHSCRLSIDDDGRGFGFVGRLTLDELDRRDMGPKLIKERVRAMRGTLTVASKPGEGANIVIEWARGMNA